jgi:hypothetical protein
MIDHEHARWLITVLDRGMAAGYTHFVLYDLDHIIKARSATGEWLVIGNYKPTTPWRHPDERVPGNS